MDLTDIQAPLARNELEDWLDLLSNDDHTFPSLTDKTDSTIKSGSDQYDSLEDLVKTFDQNVKKSFSNFKDIDIGQLAPVQVRSQEDVMNGSQVWYTLTGNFGNLLPIDYWSGSLFKKFHNSSLNIEDNKSTISDYDDQDDIYLRNSKYELKSKRRVKIVDDEELDSLSNVDDNFEFDDDDDHDDDDDSHNHGDYHDGDDDDDDDDELREQLDMHSMILARNMSGQLDRIVTAEDVLNEINALIPLACDINLNDDDDGDSKDDNHGKSYFTQECLDDLTPDSGFLSNHNDEDMCASDLINDLNLSYCNYISTFRSHTHDMLVKPRSVPYDSKPSRMPMLDRAELDKLDMSQLNEMIDLIEENTKHLSESLVQELARRDELEFEKETRNTFIFLIMSIQEKRRLLNSFESKLSPYSSMSESSNYIYHNESSKNSSITNAFANLYLTSLNLTKSRKTNRKSASHHSYANNMNEHSTHLTTVIPYNSEIVYSVQHLQLLNELLKAINDDSYLVPELLTNYILKVICPT